MNNVIDAVVAAAMEKNHGRPLMVVSDGESRFVADAASVIESLIEHGYFVRAYGPGAANVDNPDDPILGYADFCDDVHWYTDDEICPYAIAEADEYTCVVGELAACHDGTADWTLTPPAGYRCSGSGDDFELVKSL